MASESNSKHKHKMAIILSSDSDSEDDVDDNSCDKKPNLGETSTNRKSSRIKEKRQTEFVLPSRDSVWNQITDYNISQETSLKSLVPNRVVNNFTKVYNTYNCEGYDNASDESDYEISECESEQSYTHKRKTKTSRIANHHKRVRIESSSSEEENNKRSIIETVEQKHDNEETVFDLPEAQPQETDSDDDIVVTPSRKKNINKSLLESDEGDGSDHQESLQTHADEEGLEDLAKNPSKQRKKNSLKLESDSEDTEVEHQKKGVALTGIDKQISCDDSSLPSKEEYDDHSLEQVKHRDDSDNLIDNLKVNLISSGNDNVQLISSESDNSEEESSETSSDSEYDGSRSAKLSAKKEKQKAERFKLLKLAQLKRKQPKLNNCVDKK